MALLLALLLQSEEELRRIAERLDRAAILTGPRAGEERGAAWAAIESVGPAILRHLAARFPGSTTVQLNAHCGNAKMNPGFHSEIIAALLRFGEPAVPHITPSLGHKDPRTRMMAAFTLTQLPFPAAVAPLIEAVDDPDKGVSANARWALRRVAFREFSTAGEYRAWHAPRKDRSRADWLREALAVKELPQDCRREAVEAAPLLLPGREGLLPLIGALCDAGWEEARFPLESLTHISFVPPGRPPYALDPEEREAEREGWRGFRARPELERDLAIAIRAFGRGGVPYVSPRAAAKLLLGNDEKAVEAIEREVDRRPESAGWWRDSLYYVTTDRTCPRVLKLLARAENPEHEIAWVFENARNPDLAPYLLRHLADGIAGPRGAFLESFPKLCRPFLVPDVLKALPEARGEIRRAMIRALGETGDIRGFEAFRTEVMVDPNLRWLAAALIPNFPGDEAIAELHRMLGAGSAHERAVAARALADKGDNSGIPVLLELLKSTDRLDREVARIAGRLPALVATDVVSRRVELARWFADWWEWNKERPRVDWLLDAIYQSGGIESNALALLACEDLEAIPRGSNTPERRREVVKAWLERTGFTFQKNLGRIPYRD